MMRKKPIGYNDLVEMYIMNRTECAIKCPEKMKKGYDKDRNLWYLSCGKCKWHAEFEMVFYGSAPVILAEYIGAQRKLVRQVVSSYSNPSAKIDKAAIMKEYAANNENILRLNEIIDRGNLNTANVDDYSYFLSTAYYDLMAKMMRKKMTAADIKQYKQHQADFAQKILQNIKAQKAQDEKYYVQTKTPYYKIANVARDLKTIGDTKRPKTIKTIGRASDKKQPK